MSALLSGKSPRAISPTEKIVLITSPSSNTKRVGMIWRRFHNPTSLPQRKAQLALAELGASTRGQRGTYAGGVNKTAVMASTQLAGQGRHGGNPEQLRRIRYARADRTIARLRQIVGGGGAAPAGPVGPAMGETPFI